MKKLLFLIPKNRLLAEFSRANRERVFPHLERVEAEQGKVICEAGDRLEYAYFPDGAVLSLYTVLQNGTAFEATDIGREGAFGHLSSIYCRTSFNRCLVQKNGGLLRVPSDVLQAEFSISENLRQLFVNYTETLLSQIQQTIACNFVHTVQQRICRWFLTMQDRTDNSALNYSPEALANMLGLSHLVVAQACEALQAAAFIRNQSDAIQILDREGLEKTACECYAIVKARYDEFLTPYSYAGRRKTMTFECK